MNKKQVSCSMKGESKVSSIKESVRPDRGGGGKTFQVNLNEGEERKEVQRVSGGTGIRKNFDSASSRERKGKTESTC